jgi:hypothetical protein
MPHSGQHPTSRSRAPSRRAGRPCEELGGEANAAQERVELAARCARSIGSGPILGLMTIGWNFQAVRVIVPKSNIALVSVALRA